MPEYKIERWDPVIVDKNQFPMPMIYIKPDKKFLDYAKENDYMIVGTVKGTNTEYDGRAMAGVIDSSGYFPNFRPNFYNDKGYFVVTFFAQWKGYPKEDENGIVNNGTVTIRGLKGKDAIQLPPPQEYSPPVATQYAFLPESDPNGTEFYNGSLNNMSNNPKKNNLDYTQIAVIGATIVFFLGVLFIVNGTERKRRN